MPNITAAVAAVADRVTAWRRGFHMCPELSYHETSTGETVRAVLAELNIPVVRPPNSESFYAALDGSVPGPATLLRADMDALPIQEISGQPYKSRRDGVMHACGHDAHTAMMLGVATVLSGLRAEPHTPVIFCFQSAEEVSGGAVELLDALRESNLEIGMAAGLHIWSPIPTGQIQIIDGPAMAGLYAFKITLTGRGGHGSRPDLSIDPIKPLCDLVLRLSALPSRLISPLDSAAVHIGCVEGGALGNIFPDTASLQGGVRFFKPEHYRLFKDAIDNLTRAAASEWGVTADIQELSSLPPVINSPGAVSRARVAASHTPRLALHESQTPLCASDNMGLFLREYPGVYAFLGCGNREKGAAWEHHNARFDIDEDAMRLGVEFLCRFALQPLS
ncbi:MAG: amidohydrolase [Oscillospiraceae bacterium]|nr:amidohydrolase [Oscillospiraceae bacterium]